MEPKSSIETAEEMKVPDELLQKLHAATERFHQARKLMEQSVGSAEMGHQKSVDHATEQVKVAEREVEEITLQIHTSLTPPTPTEMGH